MLRGESPIACQGLLPFIGDPPMHCFCENTSVQYSKEAVTSELQTESEDNQTLPISFSFPPLFYTQRQKHTPPLHAKIDEICSNKSSMVIKCKIRPFRIPKTAPGKYPNQLKINQVGQNNKNPNWLV